MVREVRGVRAVVMVVMVVDGAERAECATLGLVCYVDEAYNLKITKV